MSRSRRREPPVEDSWRIVDGEHDSFDTTILPTSTSDSSDIILTQNSSSSFPSQQYGAPLGAGSQDSIRDFATHQEDEQVILREPFRPSLPPTPVRGGLRSLEPQFRMPLVDVEGDRDRRSGRNTRPARATVRDDGVRRRTGKAAGAAIQILRRGSDGDYVYGSEDVDKREESVRDRLGESLPTALYNVLFWSLSVIGLAFRYAQKPLAILLAIYLSLGSLIIAQNLVTKSLSASLSPLCRIPFAPALLHLPFCPDVPSSPFWSSGNGTSPPVEFDDLMNVQSHFEQVLEKSAEGVSLPLEMKKSETSIRDLRTLVRNSQIQGRDELVLEFDEYIDIARTTASDLQKFNTHVGAAVDSVISINRWTSRYIDSLDPSDTSATQTSPSFMSDFASWIFYPFTPALQPFDERLLLDKYIEHTSHVSSRISTLILEAQAVLRLLNKAENHLDLIYDITSRNSDSLSTRREQVLWNLWTLVGANNARLADLSAQLRLLRTVDYQRSTAVAQVSALILELEAIQAGLGDLRDRVAEPGLLQGAEGAAGKIPLSVHIETIDRGVERLEAARRRIRAAEDDRVREALSKGGVKDEPLLEGR
ncbi:hypothetical protein NLU13_1440 [Sarocladium strictum]|uniref:Uncharacterized protein n=1 Tax=Sarocladium strictum TaxID=5046 RepID=A0AA39GQZ6_SARSR|nr:hypothetical protein NLU13_1440 [Sarocladium strictum]